MAKIPDSPEQIFELFSQDVRKVFGSDLISIALYGSGARGEYVAKKSDINFLVVLTRAGIDRLQDALGLVAKWRKSNVAVPLFVSKEYIDTALDTFPIEFLDMQRFHRQVWGKDVLAELQIDSQDLRHQIERELRGKLLYLRTGFLAAGNDRDDLKSMLAASVPAISAIFEGLLHLKKMTVPQARKEIFEAGAKAMKLNADVFRQVMNVQRGEWHGSKVQLQEVAQAYVKEINNLVIAVDKM